MEMHDVKSAYDRVATAYAKGFVNELDGKPLDRALLGAFAELTRGEGRVLDLGCGPGQVARYVADRGVDVVGVDLSPQMIVEARALHSSIPFRVSDMMSLDDADGSIAGITAFYAIVHLALADVERAFREWRRVLVPGGRVLLSFHVGQERIHLDEFLGQAVSMTWTFHDQKAIEALLERSGFVVDASLWRRGDAAVEHPSVRAYVLARAVVA